MKLDLLLISFNSKILNGLVSTWNSRNSWSNSYHIPLFFISSSIYNCYLQLILPFFIFHEYYYNNREENHESWPIIVIVKVFVFNLQLKMSRLHFSYRPYRLLASSRGVNFYFILQTNFSLFFFDGRRVVLYKFSLVIVSSIINN